MSQVRRALVAFVSIIAIVLGVAPTAFASAAAAASASPTVNAAAVHTKAATPGAGYWLADSSGGIFSGGGATFHGGTAGAPLTRPIVGIASTPTREGYWLVASDGGVFSFGDAKFYGSTGAITLNKPIVGIASTPSGHGYWMVASDGGIFSFGDAHFFGSTGAMALNKPIVGMASSPTGHGYYLVASDGGIFAFGNAPFHGSTGAMTLNKPISGISTTPSGHGYWMVASDGGVFSFGDAGFHGSTGAITLNQPIVGMTATPSGHGYWFVAADGGVFTFGDAHFFGSGTQGTHTAVVGMAGSAIAPATKLEFTTQPGDSAGGSSFSTQPVVTVETAGNAAAVTDASNVTLAITTPAGATLFCTANPKAADTGVATFSSCGIDLPGTYTLTATDGALDSAVSDSIVVGSAATQLAFTTQPSATATGGTNFAQSPHVTVQDGAGTTIATDTSNVTLTLTTPNGATLGCNNNTVAAVAGVASFVGCDINHVGTYTLTATDGSLAGATSTAIVISVGAATRLGFTTSPSNSTGGIAFAPNQPQVAVQDAGGNTVITGAGTATLTITTPAGATLTCTTSNGRTVAAGVAAAFAGCAIDLVGNYTLTATGTGGNIGAFTGVSNTFAITAGAATHLGFTTSPSASTGGIAFAPNQPQVSVQDAGGNTVTTANGIATLTITTPAGAALTCTTSNARTVTNGVAAAFAGCAINLVGTYTLTATGSTGNIAGLVGTSATFAITAGAPAAATFSVQPSATATTATAFTTSPSVTIRDAGGNLVANGTSVVLSITLPNGTGGVLTCGSGLTVATASGVAAFTACQIDTAGTYQLHAVDGAATANSTAVVVS